MQINTPQQNTLFVSIKSPEGILFEGSAIAVSSFNDDGPFDILPMHANFISIIKKKLVLFETKDKVKEFKVDNAILKASENFIRVFLGIENLQA